MSARCTMFMRTGWHSARGEHSGAGSSAAHTFVERAQVDRVVDKVDAYEVQAAPHEPMRSAMRDERPVAARVGATRGSAKDAFRRRSPDVVGQIVLALRGGASRIACARFSGHCRRATAAAGGHVHRGPHRYAPRVPPSPRCSAQPLRRTGAAEKLWKPFAPPRGGCGGSRWELAPCAMEALMARLGHCTLASNS